MKIAQVAPLYESVPPRLYGGTERVVSNLTEELIRLGHEVTLFASGDSITSATLEKCCPRALRLDSTCRDSLAPHVRMLGRVFHRAHEFDVIHCHTDYLGLPLTRLVSTPTLTTLHGRLDIPDIAPIWHDYPEAPVVSISDAQRRPLPEVNWADTIHHGLRPDAYDFHPQPGDYLLFLGRICPEKRPDAAIRVACRTGFPLKIAAKVDPADRQYYESEIKELMNHPLVDYLGEVDDEAKRELVGGALALLFPIDWPEPFGLVMIEALACGTPVIARPRGSVPEILKDGRTAIFCETEDEMVDAVKRIGSIDRATCRAEFDRRFTVSAMAKRYLRVYDRLAGETRARPTALRAVESRASMPPGVGLSLTSAGILDVAHRGNNGASKS